MQGATANTDPRLVQAFAEMSPVGSRPRGRVGMRIMDAGRGRPVAPLGTFPADAEAVALSGKSTFHRVVAPLDVMRSKIKALFGITSNVPLDAVIVNAKRESDEAECSGFRVALSFSHLTLAELHDLDREATEAEFAWGQVREAVQSRLTEMSR